MSIVLTILGLVTLWIVCATVTVWFAARFAGSDSALLNFVIWPIALLCTLCVLANEKARIGGALGALRAWPSSQGSRSGASHMTPCKRCGPCQRATRFSLKRWWHRFTLGRTSTAIAVPPPGYPGSLAAMAYAIELAAYDRLPLSITHEVVTRRALDVPVGTVRIVLETCE